MGYVQKILQAILGRLFATQQGNRTNLDRTRRLWYLRKRTFDCHYQNVISRRETGQ